DLLPTARQQAAAGRARTQVAREILERQGHRPLPAAHEQRLPRRDAGHRHHALGAELGPRYVDDLVALALVEFRQLRGGDGEQVAGAGDRDDAVGLQARDLRRLQHLRPGGQRLQRLARLLSREQVLETGDEAVAVRGGEHEAGVVLTGRQRLERSARRGREAAGQRLAVAARARQRIRQRRVAAALGIEERDLLGAAAAYRGQQLVAFAVRQRRRVHVVALGRAHPALLAEHDGHRLAGHQLGLVQRLRGLARDQRGHAFVAELLGVRQQLVLDQLAQLGLAAERGDQAVALAVEFVLLAADLHFLQPRELAQLGVE